jgi:FixJ family two-component response regulator
MRGFPDQEGWLDEGDSPSYMDASSRSIEVRMAQPASAIVVIDDDPSVRRALQRLLRAAGFVVETFATGREFLEAGEWTQTACLVLDIHLPGMSGFELQEHLAVAGALIPIVFITAHDDAAMRERAMRAGVTAYLRKPVDQHTLLEAVERALRENAPGESNVPDMTG